MKKNLSKIILGAAFATLSPIVASLPTFAQVGGPGDPFCVDANRSEMGEAAWRAAGCDTTPTDGLAPALSNIITNVIAILGLVAVIAIIVGGVSYMTASGDQSKIKKAKDTILYAVIGLVVVLLSYAIVNWVIGL